MVVNRNASQKCEKCHKSFRSIRGKAAHSHYCKIVPVASAHDFGDDDWFQENVCDTDSDPDSLYSNEISDDDSSGYDSDTTTSDASVDILTTETSIENASNIYFEMQKEFVDKTYGSKAFLSTSFDDFSNEVLQEKGKSQTTIDCLELYGFAENAELSRAKVNKLVALINSFGPRREVPSNFQRIKRVVERSKADLRLLKYTTCAMD
jgi:hypothetical protein